MQRKLMAVRVYTYQALCLGVSGKNKQENWDLDPRYLNRQSISVASRIDHSKCKV